MEVLLNLVWAITMGGLFLIGARQHARAQRPYSWSILVVSALCIATLLFPSFSVSDDLSTARAELETSAGQFAKVLPTLDDTVILTFVVLTLPSTWAVARAQLGTIAALTSSVPLEGFFTRLPERAPPSRGFFAAV